MATSRGTPMSHVGQARSPRAVASTNLPGQVTSELKKHGIYQLIVIGLIAHTCIEATRALCHELGYEVTVVRDAAADSSDDMMHAALDVNMPNYASAIVSTEEIVVAIAML